MEMKTVRLNRIVWRGSFPEEEKNGILFFGNLDPSVWIYYGCYYLTIKFYENLEYIASHEG